jgi:hypothetical protein
MENLKKWIRHNQGLVASVFVCVVLVAAAFGCQVTTESPLNPDQKVTRQELKIEAQTYAAKLELAYADLDKKDAIINAVLEAGLAYAQGGGVSPLGLASTMMSIIGVGAVVDNRRKDAVIKSKTNALALIHQPPTVVGTDTTPGHVEA